MVQCLSFYRSTTFHRNRGFWMLCPPNDLMLWVVTFLPHSLHLATVAWSLHLLLALLRAFGRTILRDGGWGLLKLHGIDDTAWEFLHPTWCFQPKLFANLGIWKPSSYASTCPMQCPKVFWSDQQPILVPCSSIWPIGNVVLEPMPNLSREILAWNANLHHSRTWRRKPPKANHMPTLAPSNNLVGCHNQMWLGHHNSGMARNQTKLLTAQMAKSSTSISNCLEFVVPSNTRLLSQPQKQHSSKIKAFTKELARQPFKVVKSFVVGCKTFTMSVATLVAQSFLMLLEACHSTDHGCETTSHPGSEQFQERQTPCSALHSANNKILDLCKEQSCGKKMQTL